MCIYIYIYVYARLLVGPKTCKRAGGWEVHDDQVEGHVEHAAALRVPCLCLLMLLLCMCYFVAVVYYVYCLVVFVYAALGVPCADRQLASVRRTINVTV